MKEIESNCNELWYSEKLDVEFLVYWKDVEKDEYHCMHYLPGGGSSGINRLCDLKEQGFEYKEEFEKFYKYASWPKEDPVDAVGMTEEEFLVLEGKYEKTYMP